ncbi:MAG: phosphoribosylglycinamide formyltransferase [Flavobacterium sp.]|uniref:phosphoribosylglycinamide formyltransferase n=1 Tax=Flavobacterium sp. TaxID=239 RepID=UPI0025B911DC|nr:phosphoribosylglycinamide formyltransferase [Flavobacterium sp.]MBA4133764.1 phosphoribosylglycinamide formyltransferase [Flavobacterium sp.]
MKKIVLFASGNGSNVENIIQHFKNSKLIAVAGVFTNNPQAKVLEKAKNHNVASFVFSKNDLESNMVLQKLQSIQPDLIVLAGFLLKFPEHIIAEFPNKIINVHPALLPKYGGKGMYGMHVHKAVLDNKEKETGITIHYVNEHYDEGEFIFQTSVNIEECQTPEEIAAKIHELEHLYFPKTIERLLDN